MKLLDNLHKMGILRVGVAGGTYKSSKDMPDELMFDNVYDREKDLVGGKGTEKVEGGGAGDGRKPAGKGSGLLFLLLLIVSVLVANFFGMMVGFDFNLMINFIIWYTVFLVAWLFFVLMLFRYKLGLCSMKSILKYFFIFLIVSIGAYSLVEMQSREGTWGVVKDSDKIFSQNAIENNLIGADSQAQAIDETEWIDYAGVKSPIFTFRYPKSYEIQEVGTSTMVYVDRNKDPDYHIVYSVLEGANPPFKDCQQFAATVALGYEKGELRYANPRDFFGFTGCEYGINIGQNSDKIYEITYNFSTVDKSFYVTAYAKQLSDLDILSKIMQSFKLK